MDAYRAGVLVPPELAVFSAKRRINGYLPTERIISVIRERRAGEQQARTNLGDDQ